LCSTVSASSGAPQNLHSFPTRRSSDLGAEHTARSIEDKFVEHFLAARFARDSDFNIHRKHVNAIFRAGQRAQVAGNAERVMRLRSEEHTSELQSPYDLVCRLLLEKKKA